MKISKAFTFFAAALFAVGAFADAANVLISFSTTADYYADGTAVKDNEWYALCWSADDSFDGLNLDCTPVSEAEKILILAPLAEGGRCPYVVFQVDSSKAPSGGNYFVYLLDTRDANGNVSSYRKTDDGRYVPANVVNGSAAVQSYEAKTSEVGLTSTKASSSSVEVSSDGWVAVQPKIVGFDLVGDATVKITVVGMMRGLTYKVSMGSDVNDLKTTDVAPTTEDGKVSFYVTDEDARFFKVVTE